MGSTNSKKYEIIQPCENQIKITFIGAPMTGKTSIINKYINGSTDSNNITGIFPKTTKLKLNKKTCKLFLWDTIYETKLDDLINYHIQVSDIMVYVYDITDIDSLYMIEKYITDSCNLKMLVGNKFDCKLKEHQVNIDMGLQFANKYNMRYINISTTDDFMFSNFVCKLGELVDLLDKKNLII